MPTRIEWHPEAVNDLRKLGASDRERIRKALAALAGLDDPRDRLLAYRHELKGYWKFRVGDYRLVCTVRFEAQAVVLVVYLAHRSTVYSRRSIKALDKRRD